MRSGTLVSSYVDKSVGKMVLCDQLDTFAMINVVEGPAKDIAGALLGIKRGARGENRAAGESRLSQPCIGCIGSEGVRCGASWHYIDSADREVRRAAALRREWLVGG